MRYTFISDPGHGWLKVPTRDLKLLGIEDKISGYSYLSPSGKWSYLEEDCDAGHFIEAWKKFNKGHEFQYEREVLDNSATCRTYQGYAPELI